MSGEGGGDGGGVSESTVSASADNPAPLPKALNADIPTAAPVQANDQRNVANAPMAKPVDLPMAEPVNSPMAEPVDAPMAEPVDAPMAEPVNATMAGPRPQQWMQKGTKDSQIFNTLRCAISDCYNNEQEDVTTALLKARITSYIKTPEPPANNKLAAALEESIEKIVHTKAAIDSNNDPQQLIAWQQEQQNNYLATVTILLSLEATAVENENTNQDLEKKRENITETLDKLELENDLKNKADKTDPDNKPHSSKEKKEMEQKNESNQHERSKKFTGPFSEKLASSLEKRHTMPTPARA